MIVCPFDPCLIYCIVCAPLSPLPRPSLRTVFGQAQCHQVREGLQFLGRGEGRCCVLLLSHPIALLFGFLPSVRSCSSWVARGTAEYEGMAPLTPGPALSCGACAVPCRVGAAACAHQEEEIKDMQKKLKKKSDQKNSHLKARLQSNLAREKQALAELKRDRRARGAVQKWKQEERAKVAQVSMKTRVCSRRSEGCEGLLSIQTVAVWS